MSQHHSSTSAARTDGVAVPRARRLLGVAVVAALSVATLSCGSDGDSSETAFCDAGDSLRSNITGIADIDIISGGVDAVTNQLAAIRSDVDQLRASGSDVAAEEISTLETAVADLGTAIDDFEYEAQRRAALVAHVVAAQSQGTGKR